MVATQQDSELALALALALLALALALVMALALVVLALQLTPPRQAPLGLAVNPHRLHRQSFLDCHHPAKLAPSGTSPRMPTLSGRFRSGGLNTL